jgi:hypothetical protein
VYSFPANVSGRLSEFDGRDWPRKREATGKCGGRKSYKERSPEMVALARKLARYPVNGHKRSLRDVAAELEAQGYTSNGRRYAATAVARMIAS